MATEWIRFGLEVVGGLLLVFAGGRFVGRVEVAVGKVEKMSERLDAIPSIKQQLEFQETRLRRIESYHRELAGEVAEQRGRLASVHDDGE